MQCPACNKPVQGDFKFCPHCGNKNNTVCPSCGKNMMPEWVACPYCGLAAKSPYSPQNIQYKPSSHNQHDYHSDSSGHYHKRKKGLLGNFFS